ncbi:integrase [Pseudonocardia sp. AL041005-10]|nr:site-specific integrase [Pseudonocardia sp. AL041005-10]ALE78642.1 integrase [Pseudonocardia sp. AL041005-10]
MSKNVNGDGSVWKRNDGRWSGAAYVSTSTGRIERRYVYGKTKKEALSKLVGLQGRHDKGIPAGPTKLTVEQFLTEWLDHIKLPVRPQTWAGYESNVRNHLVPRLGRKKVTALSVRDVRLMVDDLKAGGTSARMVQWIHSTLRVALQHAVSEELVTRNVARSVRVAQPPRDTLSEPLTADEATAFLRAVKTHRLHGLWVTVLVLGLRRSEVCGLHWDDVDLDRGTLKIQRGLQRTGGRLQELPTKTRRSRRTVPLPAMVVDALREHQERQCAERTAAVRGTWTDTPYVFTSSVGTPLEPRTLTRTFHALLERHGFRRVRLHDLRHTCVSLLLSLGVHPRIVMEIVGHSAIEMTMNVYGHVTLDSQRDALDLLNTQLGAGAENTDKH